MSTANQKPDLKQLDKTFLSRLSIGDRLFHYPRTGSDEQSFQQSPSAEYTLYSVLELPTEEDVVIQGAFDLDEQKKSITRAELMGGEWWHIVEPK